MKLGDRLLTDDGQVVVVRGLPPARWESFGLGQRPVRRQDVMVEYTDGRLVLLLEQRIAGPAPGEDGNG